ncbi:hypothetical protein GCM10007242_41680 [Pigmentiphaga litoralis]|uniref:hypothetical protein n=1 Tax=Pigmentiphaga litoralis TaxID=516702 RepID=UPI0016733539|nr:hypothetical protein [Pigmentiphaga litoralis]GGX30641.1 hypothetical protein GCM10007242_41680 [Pigmentiphaga litoralis]
MNNHRAIANVCLVVVIVAGLGATFYEAWENYMLALATVAALIALLSYVRTASTDDEPEEVAATHTAPVEADRKMDHWVVPSSTLEQLEEFNQLLISEVRLQRAKTHHRAEISLVVESLHPKNGDQEIEPVMWVKAYEQVKPVDFRRVRVTKTPASYPLNRATDELVVCN